MLRVNRRVAHVLKNPLAFVREVLKAFQANQGLQINASFAGGGDRFVTEGLRLSPWIYSASLGLGAAANDCVDLGIWYGLQATSSGLLQQSGLAVLKVKL